MQSSSDEEAWQAAADNLGLGYQLATRFYWSRKKHGTILASSLVDEFRSAVPELLFKAAKRFDPDRGFKFSTYAGTALWRGFLTIERRETRQGQRDEVFAKEASRPEGRLDSVELDAMLSDSGLSDNERGIILAHYGEALSVVETADYLGMTVAQVRRTVGKVLPRLRRKIEPEDLYPSTSPGVDRATDRSSSRTRTEGMHRVKEWRRSRPIELPSGHEEPAAQEVRVTPGHSTAEGSILGAIRKDPELARKRLEARRVADEDAKSMERWYGSIRMRREKRGHS